MKFNQKELEKIIYETISDEGIIFFLKEVGSIFEMDLRSEFSRVLSEEIEKRYNDVHSK